MTSAIAGFSTTRLNRLDEMLQRHIDAGTMPGTHLLVWRRGEIVYDKTFGLKDVARQQPIQPDTIYRIYSMTKPIASVAALMLWEEGWFQLEDPIALYLPAFKDLTVYVNENERASLERPVTIKDVLMHTGGFTYESNGTSPVDELNAEADLRNPSLTYAQWADRLGQLPLVTQPGTAFRYSLSPSIASYLVEVISGLSFADFLQQRIFEPLEMVDTAFYVPEVKLDRVATLYGAGNWIIEQQPLTVPPIRAPGDTGLFSTTADYLRFCRMLLNGGELDGERVLGRKTVDYMTTNHLPADLLPFNVGTNPHPGYGFGLGVEVMLDPPAASVLHSVGAYGWGGLASTYFRIDPQEDIILIKMAQIIYWNEDGSPVEHRNIESDIHTVTYQALVD